MSIHKIKNLNLKFDLSYYILANKNLISNYKQ